MLLDVYQLDVRAIVAADALISAGAHSVARAPSGFCVCA
jgi:hypothetical protein